MVGDQWLAERFEEQRPHLRAVAYRMLGSLSEADDAVQEVWLRLSHADTGDVQPLEAGEHAGREVAPHHGRLEAVAVDQHRRRESI